MSETLVAVDLEVLAQPGQLLRVELEPAVADPQGFRVALLSFDTGRLWLGVHEDGGIEMRLTDEGAVSGMVRAEEEDPWWKLMGTGIWAGRAELDAEGRQTRVDLQFRQDEENPRIVSLWVRDGALRVSDRAKESSAKEV